MTPDSVDLVLLDASNLIYRSYHAMKASGRVFSAPDGTPTGGLSSYLRTVESLLKYFPSAKFVALHEHPGGSFRDELSPEYKNERPKIDDDLRVQLGLAQSLLPLLGIPALSVPEFEADDLLCAYAKRASDEGMRVVIVSGDKDMHQAICSNVAILDPADKKERRLLGRDDTLAKFGVPPELVVSFLALMGDAVDGIAGVPGVGKKTAARLLSEKGSLEAVLASADSLSPSLSKAFSDFPREKLELSVRLATARLDVPLPVSVNEILTFEPDWSAALPELQRLAFKTWIAKAEKHVAQKRHCL